MKVILTVIGKDKVGIVAGVSQKLAELKINILDVSQTIMGEFFTMMMVCEVPDQHQDFDLIQRTLKEEGQRLEVKISIQRSEIFDAMHKL